MTWTTRVSDRGVPYKITQGYVIDATDWQLDYRFGQWLTAILADRDPGASPDVIYVTVDHSEGYFQPGNPNGMPDVFWQQILDIVGRDVHALVRLDLE